MKHYIQEVQKEQCDIHVVRHFYFKVNNTKLEARKATTTQIAYINKELCGNSVIIADSAEPRLIQELRSMGCRIIPAEKGAGSISLGIALLQDYELIVEGNNIAKELNNYVYADKGSKLYVDDFNHIIDAVRYNVTFQLGKKIGMDVR